MKFAVHFFGCKVNQYDAARWTIGFGKNYVAQPNDADVIVLFSCVVTHKAEAEVRRFVQKWKAQGKKIILTGCGTNITLTDLADESVTLVPVDQLDSFMQQLGAFRHLRLYLSILIVVVVSLRWKKAVIGVAHTA